MPLPDCAALHPGYEKIEKAAERRQTLYETSASADAARALRTGAVSHPPAGPPGWSAFLSGSCWAVAPPHLSSRPGFLGRGGSARLYDRQPGRRPHAVPRALAAPACPSPVTPPHPPP